MEAFQKTGLFKYIILPSRLIKYIYAKKAKSEIHNFKILCKSEGI
jgi:hypothetical protein